MCTCFLLTSFNHKTCKLSDQHYDVIELNPLACILHRGGIICHWHIEVQKVGQQSGDRVWCGQHMLVIGEHRIRITELNNDLYILSYAMRVCNVVKTMSIWVFLLKMLCSMYCRLVAIWLAPQIAFGRTSIQIWKEGIYFCWVVSALD